MKTNERARELRTRLFDLVTEYKEFAMECNRLRGNDFDCQCEAVEQADEAACKLAGAYASLGDLFTDFARDPQDQSFAFERPATESV